MKTLYLLRHAKSSWAGAPAADFERPLNKRGRKAAPRIGAEMAAKGWHPDIVLCSPAVRARETLARLRPPLETAAPLDIRYEEALYLAGPDTIRKHVAAIAREAESALVVGHNPGIHETALAIAAEGEPGLLGRLKAGFPTAALAVIAFATESWADVFRDTGRLEALIAPKDLG